MAENSRVRDKRDEWEGPVPVPTGVTVRFWDATLDGTLLIQHCDACDSPQFYPRIACTSCGELEPDWSEASGRGVVHSYTVCHVPGESGFGTYTPFVVAVVKLVEGPRMLAMIDTDPSAVEIGTPVEVTFWQVSDEAAVPVFVSR